jgi:hypothetical protein
MASTWAATASNETISFNNLQNAVNTNQFVAKTSIPVSNEQITKADANTYVYIDTSYGPYSSKSSNQLVVKSNLQPSLFSLALGPEYDTIGGTCNLPAPTVQTVTYSGNLGIGTIVDGVSVFGNLGYFLIVGSYLNQHTLSTIGIDDNGEVFYLEFYCPF